MKKDKYFLNCCSGCGWKCCKVWWLYITEKEYNTVPESKRDGFKKHYSGYNTYLEKPCPFISENGCILGENRFLECKLYPLEIRWIDKLVLKQECPHNKLFDNKLFFNKGYKLLEKYRKEWSFDENDVISILNNVYPNKL